MAKKRINRIKVILAEKERTNKWLAQQMNKSEITVSRWCTNETQPSVESLIKIAGLLEVEVGELLSKSEKA